MKVGDLVVRTYGEGQRPVAVIVEWDEEDSLAHVVWQGRSKVELFAKKYSEPINASR